MLEIEEIRNLLQTITSMLEVFEVCSVRYVVMASALTGDLSLMIVSRFKIA